MTDRAPRFAMTLSADVIAVHLLRLSDPEAEEDVRSLHEAFDRDIVTPVAAQGLKAPRLVLIPAPYREIACRDAGKSRAAIDDRHLAVAELIG